MTLANLRGTPEAGLLFALPTYTFIASFLGLIAAGLWNILATGGHPHPVVAPPPLPHATGVIGRSCAIHAGFRQRLHGHGPGVEAVSNGVSAFKEPVVDHARSTLTAICLVLGLLLAGIAVVAHFLRPGRHGPDPAVLSQRAVPTHRRDRRGAGSSTTWRWRGLLAVLSLSANTSFVGFPRLCRIAARDGYLPRAFAVADRRLVFSVGIFVLTATAGGLLVLFGGITDRLIPLFAIGAFLTLLDEPDRHGGALAAGGRGQRHAAGHQCRRRPSPRSWR